MSESLRTPEDVRKVRLALLKEQNNKDLLTGELLDAKDAVLDHDHKTNYVRGVLHRQINVFLGKIENIWVRYIGWWYNGDLPNLLRKSADYLERKADTRYVHPAWKKSIKVRANKLNQVRLAKFLSKIDPEVVANNAASRKKALEKLMKNKKYDFDFFDKKLTEVENDEDYHSG